MSPVPKQEMKADPPENRRRAIFFGFPILNLFQQIWDMPSVENHPFDAYHGPEPYIFVSYSHQDEAVVFPEISRLHQLGYRIWYDEGITPGSKWNDEIALAVEEAAHFIVFISDAAISSEYVENEINYALELRKPFLAIHLAGIKLPRGLRFRMSKLQAIHKWELSEDHYYRKLGGALPAETRGVIVDEGPLVVPPPVRPPDRQEKREELEPVEREQLEKEPVERERIEEEEQQDARNPPPVVKRDHPALWFFCRKELGTEELVCDLWTGTDKQEVKIPLCPKCKKGKNFSPLLNPGFFSEFGSDLVMIGGAVLGNYLVWSGYLYGFIHPMLGSISSLAVAAVGLGSICLAGRGLLVLGGLSFLAFQFMTGGFAYPKLVLYPALQEKIRAG